MGSAMTTIRSNLQARAHISLFIFFIILLGAEAMLEGCKNTDMEEPAIAVKTAPALPLNTVHVDAVAGRTIYEKYCRYCHGKEGRGDGPVGIAVSPRPANFVEDAKRMSKTDEELFKSISEGVHKTIGGEEMAMPRWEEILSDKERRDVLAYIRLLSKEGQRQQNPAK
ncbi:MAG: cytochrome c [Deltaproteobacteria bacterium]|nr:cytochrome c [Deltaproteobacteria bacterium]